MNDRLGVPARLPGRRISGLLAAFTVKQRCGLRMDLKDWKTIENNGWPTPIEFCSRAEIVSTTVNECYLQCLKRTKKLKTGSDVQIISLKTSWIRWWRRCYGRKTDQMRKPCCGRLKEYCLEHVKDWDRIQETKCLGIAVAIAHCLLFDPYLQPSLCQSLHGRRHLDCPRLRNKSITLRNGGHKLPVRSLAARSLPDHPAIYPVQR